MLYVHVDGDRSHGCGPVRSSRAYDVATGVFITGW